MAEISDLISLMKLNKDADEKRNRSREGDDNAQLDALTSLETTFPEEFRDILKKQGMVGESKRLLHEELLEDIKTGVGKINLGAIQNFKDSFINMKPWRNAARERRQRILDSTELMRADIEDIAGTLTLGQKRQEVEWSKKGFLSKMLNPLTKKKGAREQELMKKQFDSQQKMKTFAEQTATNTGEIVKKFSIKEKLKTGLTIFVVAAVVALVAFFEEIGKQIKWMKQFTGNKLGKLFAPIKTFFSTEGGMGKVLKIFSKEGSIGKLFKGDKITKLVEPIKNFFSKEGVFGKAMTSIKGAITSVKESKFIVGIKNVFTTGWAKLTKFLEPIADFFRTLVAKGKMLVRRGKDASRLVRWAGTFGKILGKLFLPITLLMSAFDFVTGFMKGYEEGGILGGLEEGLTKLFQGLIGMPLDLLKDAVSWILGKFGFDDAAKTLDEFSFSDLIGDMFGGIFHMIEHAIDWIKGLFSWGDNQPAEDEDSKSGVLGFLKGLVDGIWGWFKGLFDFSTVGAAFATVLNIIFLPATILKGLVTGIWNWFKGLFGFDTKDTDDAAVQTTPGGVGGMLLSLITGVWTWFKGLFSWGDKEPAEDEDSKSGVMGFLKGLVEGIWGWFKGLFDFSTVGAAFATVLNIIFLPATILKGLVTGIWDWFKGLFGFDTTDTDDAAKQTKPGGLGGILLSLITGVWDWFKGLFGWEEMTDAEKAKSGQGFSLIGMIEDVITSIKEFFWNDKGTGLLQFDFMSLIPDLPWPFNGDDKEDPLVAGTNILDNVDAGIDKLEVRITKLEEAAAAAALPGQRAAAAISAAASGAFDFASGGPFRGGQSMIVGELGPEMILPSTGGQVINAQRTQQMLQAGMQRGMGGEGGGGITSINTGGNVVSAPTTNYVNNGIAARRPIILAA